MKTNKSYLKRVRVTKNGKIMTRKAGRDHFNSKESRRSQQSKNRSVVLSISNKSRARFLPGAAKKS